MNFCLIKHNKEDIIEFKIFVAYFLPPSIPLYLWSLTDGNHPASPPPNYLSSIILQKQPHCCRRRVAIPTGRRSTVANRAATATLMTTKQGATACKIKIKIKIEIKIKIKIRTRSVRSSSCCGNFDGIGCGELQS